MPSFRTSPEARPLPRNPVHVILSSPRYIQQGCEKQSKHYFSITNKSERVTQLEKTTFVQSVRTSTWVRELHYPPQQKPSNSTHDLPMFPSSNLVVFYHSFRARSIFWLTFVYHPSTIFLNCFSSFTAIELQKLPPDVPWSLFQPTFLSTSFPSCCLLFGHHVIWLLNTLLVISIFVLHPPIT